MSLLSVFVILDVGWLADHGQLFCYAGVLIGPTGKESPFYAISFASRKSKRPARPTGTKKLLAASEAID